MTPEQKLIAWSAVPGVAVIVLFYFVMGTAAEQERTDRKLASAHKQYEKYYGSHPNGTLATDLADNYDLLLNDAQNRRVEVEAKYAPSLPSEYTASTLTRASGVLQKRRTELIKQSERRSIRIPDVLPFEQGFLPDPSSITIGLAQLYLYYESMQRCFDATNEVVTADLSDYWTDEEQRLAYFTIEIQIYARLTAVSKLVDRLNDAVNGMSVRSLVLDREDDAGDADPVSAKLVLMLTTPRNELWNLQVRRAANVVQAGHNMAIDVNMSAPTTTSTTGASSSMPTSQSSNNIQQDASVRRRR